MARHSAAGGLEATRVRGAHSPRRMLNLAELPCGAPPPIRMTGGRSQQREPPGQDDDVGSWVVLIPVHLACAHEHELLLQQVPELAPIAVDRLKASKLGMLC